MKKVLKAVIGTLAAGLLVVLGLIAKSSYENWRFMRKWKKRQDNE